MPGAPQFERNPCKNLQRFALRVCRGLLFARPELDFSGDVLDPVGPFHPGLGRFVSCDDLSWEFAGAYSLQRVGIRQALSPPGAQVYRAWHDRLLDDRGGRSPEFGAIRVTYFPTP